MRLGPKAAFVAVLVALAVVAPALAEARPVGFTPVKLDVTPKQ